MKRIWVSLVAVAFLAVAAIAPVAGQEEAVTLDLEEIDGSGIEGNVRLASMNGQTDVEVLITAGLEDGAVHPVHIHSGTCDELGDVVYPLEDIEGGVSETEIDAELTDLMDGEHAVNVHVSEDEMDVYVACANIDEAAVGGPAEDEEDDAAGDDEDDAAEDEEDDAAADDDDDAATDDDDDEAADDEDDGESDDESNGTDEEDDADNGEEDEVDEEIVPAAGSVGGPSSETIALMVALMGGSALGVGILLRRQAGRTLLRQ